MRSDERPAVQPLGVEGEAEHPRAQARSSKWALVFIGVVLVGVIAVVTGRDSGQPGTAEPTLTTSTTLLGPVVHLPRWEPSQTPPPAPDATSGYLSQLVAFGGELVFVHTSELASPELWRSRDEGRSWEAQPFLSGPVGSGDFVSDLKLANGLLYALGSSDRRAEVWVTSDLLVWAGLDLDDGSDHEWFNITSNTVGLAQNGDVLLTLTTVFAELRFERLAQGLLPEGETLGDRYQYQSGPDRVIDTDTGMTFFSLAPGLVSTEVDNGRLVFRHLAGPEGRSVSIEIPSYLEMNPGSPTVGWGSALFSSDDGGETWVTASAPPLLRRSFSSVGGLMTIDSQFALIQPWAANDGLQLWRSSDGLEWEVENVQNVPEDCFGAGPVEFWVVGTVGFFSLRTDFRRERSFLCTSDDLETWVPVVVSGDPLEDRFMSSVSVEEDRWLVSAYLVGQSEPNADNDSILLYYDGQEWTTLATPSSEGGFVAGYLHRDRIVLIQQGSGRNGTDIDIWTTPIP